MSPIAPSLILVDTSVRSAAQLGHWGTISKSVQWGPHTIEHTVTALVRGGPKRDEAYDDNARCLSTVGQLARDGRIVLATYDELQFEEMNGSRPVRGTVADAFVGVDWQHVKSAVDRSYFIPTMFPPGYQADMLVEFCQSILLKDFELARWPAEFVESLPEASRRNLANRQRFQSLAAGAPATLLPDLFHLWTGEVAGCDFFLTMDVKLINFCFSHVHRDLPCRPITPAGLLTELGGRLPEAGNDGQVEILNLFEALPDQRFGIRTRKS